MTTKNRCNIMRAIRLIGSVVTASAALSGCGTLCTATDPKCGKFAPFSGTRASANGHATQLDVPFSFLLDVVLLPITIPKAIMDSTDDTRTQPGPSPSQGPASQAAQ